MRVCIPSLCCQKTKQKTNPKKKKTGSMRILVKNIILRATLNQKGGRHIGSHEGFRSYALHNIKEGRPFMFWRGTRFIRLRGKSQTQCTKRQFIGSKRERWISIKCKRPTRAGRNGGISWIAARNRKLHFFFFPKWGSSKSSKKNWEEKQNLLI